MKITKDQYDALTAEQKKLWKASGAEYELVGDTEIAGEMRRARDRETQAAAELRTQVQTLTTQLEELQSGTARKNNDIATIERNWQGKLDALTNTTNKTVATLRANLEKVVVDAAVEGMAAEIFVKPKRDARLLRERVMVEWDGDVPTIKVKGADGKASSLSLDDLKKETVDNKDFGDILIGSKASGSGGAGGSNGGGAAKKPSEYTEQERVNLFRSDPTRFKELFPSPN